MEVFVAILLLFGAYSLGAAGHDEEGDRHPVVAIPAESSNNPARQATALEAKSVEPVVLLDCAAERHYVIYKDLTRAYAREGAAETKPPRDCGGSCQDE